MSAGSILELSRTESYLVHEAIAQGGMASVHVGVREGALGFSRVVAVKRLHSQFANDERFVAMLIDEARIVARIRHLNVVPTLDVLVVSGEVFVIMEFVRGASLSRLIELSSARDRLLALPMVSAIVSGALRGLHAAHEATDLDGTALDIVHRDVSPQNILVGISGVSRVIDFGVAHALGKSDPTRSGEFKGKLSYAAPEQLGDGSATRRTDVYAAGIVLWELVTGQRLFKAATDLETFKRAAHAKIARPDDVLARDERMRTQRGREETAVISDVVMRALEKEPSRRYATAAEMADALESAIPPCRATEVGAWVQGIARAELANEEAIVMRAEEAMARRQRLQRELGEAAIKSVGGGANDAGTTKADLPERRNAPTRYLGSERLPTATFVALALSAAAGAGIGAALFSALAR